METLIQSIKELIESTNNYRIAGVRLLMIITIALTITSVSVIFHYFPDLLELANTLVDNGSNPRPLTKTTVLRIGSFLEGVNLPPNHVIGIENIKATGVRDIYWLSDETAFSNIIKEEVFFANRNPPRLQYAKGFSYLVKSCNKAPIPPEMVGVVKYNYFVCPILFQGEAVGVVWVLFETSQDGTLEEQYIPVILEIKNYIERNGFN